MQFSLFFETTPIHQVPSRICAIFLWTFCSQAGGRRKTSADFRLLAGGRSQKNFRWFSMGGRAWGDIPWADGTEGTFHGRAALLQGSLWANLPYLKYLQKKNNLNPTFLWTFLPKRRRSTKSLRGFVKFWNLLRVGGFRGPLESPNFGDLLNPRISVSSIYPGCVNTYSGIPVVPRIRGFQWSPKSADP